MNLLYKIALTTMIIEQISRFIPKLLWVFLYVYITCITLILILHGHDYLLNDGALYDPVYIFKNGYNIVVKWWWPSKRDLGLENNIKVVISFIIPNLLMMKLPKIAKKYGKIAIDIISKKASGFLGSIRSKISNNYKKTSKDVRKENEENIQKNTDSNSNVSFEADTKTYTEEELKIIKNRVLKQVEENIDSRIKSHVKGDK